MDQIREIATAVSFLYQEDPYLDFGVEELLIESNTDSKIMLELMTKHRIANLTYTELQSSPGET